MLGMQLRIRRAAAATSRGGASSFLLSTEDGAPNSMSRKASRWSCVARTDHTAGIASHSTPQPSKGDTQSNCPIHSYLYMWVPQVGSCARMAQVWRGGKGPESPGLLPALSGHGERIARTTPPPRWALRPGIHQRCTGGRLKPGGHTALDGRGREGLGAARASEALRVRAAGGPFRTPST